MTGHWWIVCSALSLVGCSLTGDTAPPQAPTNQGVCLALATAMPVKYRGNSTDAETIANIRAANAAYRAACDVP